MVRISTCFFSEKKRSFCKFKKVNSIYVVHVNTTVKGQNAAIMSLQDQESVFSRYFGSKSQIQEPFIRISDYDFLSDILKTLKGRFS